MTCPIFKDHFEGTFTSVFTAKKVIKSHKRVEINVRIQIRIHTQYDGYVSWRLKNIRIGIHNTGFLKATHGKSRIRLPVYGSKDPSDPYQNVTGPEHYFIMSTSNVPVSKHMRR
jgi:hypothetical protein